MNVVIENTNVTELDVQALTNMLFNRTGLKYGHLVQERRDVSISQVELSACGLKRRLRKALRGEVLTYVRAWLDGRGLTGGHVRSQDY